MSRSIILDIYAAFAATEITVGDKVVKVFPLANVPNSVTSLSTPLRVLTPLQQFSPPNLSSDGVGGFTRGSGGVLDLDWVIHDILLWAPLMAGRGLSQHSTDLIQYCAEYIDMLRDDTLLVLPANTWMQRWSLHVEMIEFPIYSKMFYFGVRSTMIVREKLG